MKHQKIDAWDNFFPSTANLEIFENKHRSNQYVAQATHVYVTCCTFEESKDTSSNGGAICFATTDDSAKMVVEQCIFYDCHTSAIKGGAISMQEAGSCVFNKCCSNLCSCNLQGQFISTDMTDDISHINQIFDSSAINSFPQNENTNLFGVIDFYDSVIKINTMNFSRNKCYKYPSAFCCPTLSIENVTSFVEYCSISNITSDIQGICFASLSDTRVQHIMKSSNLIENEVTLYGLIASQAHLTVEGCTILRNQADHIFSTSQTMTITVINCTCDNVTTEGTVVLSNLTPSPREFINGIFPTYLGSLCYDTKIMTALSEDMELCLSILITFIILL